MDLLWQIAIALLPSVGIGFLFYKIIKAIVEGDRNERLAYAQWQAGLDEAGAKAHSAADGDADSAARTD